MSQTKRTRTTAPSTSKARRAATARAATDRRVPPANDTATPATAATDRRPTPHPGAPTRAHHDGSFDAYAGRDDQNVLDEHLDTLDNVLRDVIDAWDNADQAIAGESSTMRTPIPAGRTPDEIEQTRMRMFTARSILQSCRLLACAREEALELYRRAGDRDRNWKRENGAAR